MRKKIQKRSRARALSVVLSAALALSGLPAIGVGTVQAAGEEVSAQGEEADAVTDSGSFGGEKDASGQEITPDTHQWSFAAGSGVLTISGKGPMPDYDSSTRESVPWYGYKDAIKKIVFEGEVEAVGKYAFYGYAAVEQVDFGGAQKLAAINESAFASTSGLQTLAGTENIKTLDKNAFASSGLKSVSMPGVRVVTEAAFKSCKSLESVVFSGATSFGKDAFNACAALKEVHADNVSELAGAVFNGCQALEHLSLPELTRITAGNVFQKCTKLRTVDFPKLTSITGGFMFQECTSLQYIDFPNVTTFSQAANSFAYKCTSLVYANLPNAEICGYGNTNCFADCSSLVWADISSFSYQGLHAVSFKNTKNLRRVYIKGDKITTAFNQSNSYANTNFHTSGLDIYFLKEKESKFDASSYATVHLNPVDGAADLDALKAKESRLQLSMEDYDNDAPKQPAVKGAAAGAEVTYRYYKDLACQTLLDSQNPSTQPTEPGVYYVQAAATAVTESQQGGQESEVLYFETISYPMEFTVYGEKEGDGFSYHNKTLTLTIKDATKLNGGSYASQNDVPWKDYLDYKAGKPVVKKVALAAGLQVTKIPPYAFYGLKEMKEFDLPDTVTSIGGHAFQNCMAWEAENVLTSKVTEIGEYAFYCCTGIKGTMTFNDNIAEIPACVLGVCRSVTKIEYSDQVTAFGTRCFYDTGVTELKIPEGMTSLPAEFFAKTKVVSVKLPEGMTEIPKGLFQECADLKEVEIPDTVTSIGEMAFNYSGITSFSIPNGVTAIGDSAFANTKDLETIEIPASVTALPNKFLYRSGVKKVIVPETVTQIIRGNNQWNGITAFVGCDRLEYLEFLKDDYDDESFHPCPDPSKEGYDDTFQGVPSTAMVVCGDGTATYTLLKNRGTKKEGNAGWLAEEILYEREKLLENLQEEYQTARAEADKVPEADYASEPWAAFQKALKEVDDLAAKGDTTYDKVINRKNAKLAISQAALPLLRDTYQKAQGVNGSDYDTEDDTWFEYLDQMDRAKELLQKTDITLQEIIDGEKALRGALAGIILLPKAEVDEAIQAAQALKEADYTPESWAALQKAIQDAQAICKDATTVSQVAEAKKIIDDAVAALVKVSNGDPSKEPETEPSAQPSEEPGTNPSAVPSKKPGTEPSAAPSKEPGTEPSAQPSAKPGTDLGAQPTKKPGGITSPKKVTVKKASLKKVKSTKKKTLTVQWKKLSGVSGYQVQLALNKKFKKGKKTYAVKKAKTTKKTIKGLKRKKTYYVRIRAYKSVKGKKTYGKWSSVKKAKVK